MTETPASEVSSPTPTVYQLRLEDTPSSKQVSPTEAANEWNEPLLRQNAVWFCRLRWMVIGTLVMVAILGLFPASLSALDLDLNPLWPLAVAGILIGTNLVFSRLATQSGRPGQIKKVKLLLWSQIVSDLLLLTAVIHWLGGVFPAAPFMYLFHIILACIVFTPYESLVVVGLAAGFYLFCLLLEFQGVLERSAVLASFGEIESAWSPRNFLSFGVGFMLMIWAVIWYLVSRLADILRHREFELAVTNLRLKASSEERANHMLQTTHQLKAPFAAIHAQTQLLLGNYCGNLESATRNAVEKISARSMALSRQIQEMLQLANLRSQGQTHPPRKRLSLDHLIDATITRVEPSARQRGIRIQKNVEPITVIAVEDHLTMLIDNLIVNAVNYSHDHGEVSVDCRRRGKNQVEFSVRDHGIGIPPEKLPKIFDDYFRTDEAVQHNRTSTGLGLAVVRQVAREGRIAVRVESAPGWGARFTATFTDHAASLEPKA